jgi:DNA primase
MIPPAFVHELLTRVDIVEVVGRSVELKRAGSTWKGLCPFHGEKSPSFTVTPSRQTYHCFGCGVHGNAVGFLMEQHGMGFVEAVRDLAQQAGLSVPEEPASRRSRRGGAAEAEAAHPERRARPRRRRVSAQPEGERSRRSPT